ncbi:septation protein SepH [Nocardiopsis quinghaiensis]|uniref:septation protein SepH n=1 Tax=Nocardiopsis quinghaiensis TaxID=464995 RepID=UPI00123AE346|nr:septation protein SepH [Nocardiopsis quinghaiensis]
MHELRLVAVSEDGTYLVLASAGRGTRFMLPVDDRLRAAVRGQFSRLGQYEIEVENPLRPKEIQARIRSGETAEAISEISGIPIERVRWFEGPVLQEREYIAQQAQRASVRSQGDAAPGPSLEELVTKRIGAHQLETGDAAWDSWKREDRSWQLKLVFMHGGDERVAHWLYEPRHNSVTPADEEAALFSSPEPVSSPGANVTPFAPRRPEAATDLPRIDAQSAAERRPDHAVPRRRSSDVSHDEPLRSAPVARPENDRFDEARPAPVDYHAADRDEDRFPERRPRESEREWYAEPRVERPAERPEPRTEPADQRRQRPEPVDQRRRRPEPERRPAIAYTEPMERPRRPERRPAPEWPPETRPARPAEPETAPPAAEDPVQARPAPRRRRATIDLNDAGVPRRAAEEPPAAAVPAAANGGPEHSAPKRKGRGRRASVPSWDEIMFGSKKDE